MIRGPLNVWAYPPISSEPPLLIITAQVAGTVTAEDEVAAPSMSKVVAVELIEDIAESKSLL